jgi:hypothetical protein
MTTMSAQKPGRSIQEVGTPRDFLNAFEKRFGVIDHDLAAHGGNAVCNSWFGPDGIAEDTWAVPWRGVAKISWLNPEFKDCGKAALKCWTESLAMPPGDRIYLFVPLSTSNWARDFVHGKASVFGLNPRITFVGHKTAYPKDMMLCEYGLGVAPSFTCWRWK